jgi:hypothetical protein
MEIQAFFLKSQGAMACSDHAQIRPHGPSHQSRFAVSDFQKLSLTPR